MRAAVPGKVEYPTCLQSRKNVDFARSGTVVRQSHRLANSYHRISFVACIFESLLFGVFCMATTTAFRKSSAAAAWCGRRRLYIIAFTEEAYDETTLSTAVSPVRLKWYPAAWSGNRVSVPVGTHHTCGH
ncbi:hypothetical protein GGTG_13694 [Gaeumannomyces tritici R3-111a-1]|uniref:Uncharacterized protein n=1 Tax=Gaeumannomyces tritici (strain R3-111a-1) TaxID=644352 RepID=J3PJK8_GAET3|nr:hypothetical protein GGTG_13694 [Gaeumannomyces tritici R3-111a-1]EJT68742.1 hypothetical protein GGTG_13694 [Gaeumannomyces tritici R3-111a-1]